MSDYQKFRGWAGHPRRSPAPRGKFTRVLTGIDIPHHPHEAPRPRPPRPGRALEAAPHRARPPPRRVPLPRGPRTI